MTDEARASWPGPLAGVKVLDFTRVLAGPFATQILGDLGATIYKLESPAGGDETRKFAPLRGGESHYFLAINRSKHSIVVDLRHQEGQQIARQLAGTCDVILENFRPGVMDKLGLGYSALSVLYPKLVYCAISGFGLTGPLRDKPSFDIVTQALTGALSVNGELGRAPVKLGLPMGDLVGGLFGAIGVLAALQERTVTGRGRLVDISLHDGLLGLMGYLPQLAQFTGKDPVPMGSSHPSIVPYGSYAALDGQILIACLTQNFWSKLCEAIDCPAAANDPRFADLAGRLLHRAEVDAMVSAAIGRKPLAYWLEQLGKFDVPHAPILGVIDALHQPQSMVRDMWVNALHPRLGEMKLVGRPIKFPGSVQSPLSPPPVLAQHTAEILQKELGYSPQKIAMLLAAKVIDVVSEDPDA